MITNWHEDLLALPYIWPRSLSYQELKTEVFIHSKLSQGFIIRLKWEQNISWYKWWLSVLCILFAQGLWGMWKIETPFRCALYRKIWCLWPYAVFHVERSESCGKGRGVFYFKLKLEFNKRQLLCFEIRKGICCMVNFFLYCISHSNHWKISWRIFAKS